VAVVPSAFAAAFPAGPMIDANGEIMPAWRGFLLQLFNRTGGSRGSNAATSTTALAAETAARIAADLTLSSGESSEAAARAAAIAAEAASRSSEDETLAQRIATLASTIGGTGGAPVLPLVDGLVALVGVSAQLARADHVHPLPPGLATYIFTQATPAALWTINHDLGKFPSVDVIDSTGLEVEGDVKWITSNQITLTFAAAFSGSAYLN
jgi:hypothetical protein